MSSNDVILSKLTTKYARASAFMYDMLVLDWWPAVGSGGAMPPIGTAAMDTWITDTLTAGSQTPSDSVLSRWYQYWAWVTL